MKILHIMKTEPDKQTNTLVDIISEGKDATVFDLYDEHADYERLVDLIFDYDKVICWW